MKRTKKYQSEFFTSGKYEVEVIDFKNKFGEDQIDVWLNEKECGHKMYMFGLLYEQPSANDGKTHYTREELFEIIEANLPEYKEMYREELEMIEQAFNEKFA